MRNYDSARGMSRELERGSKRENDGAIISSIYHGHLRLESERRRGARSCRQNMAKCSTNVGSPTMFGLHAEEG